MIKKDSEKEQEELKPVQEIVPTVVPPLEKMKEEYPHIFNSFLTVEKAQLELFSKKHLDYGMSNVAAGTQLKDQAEVNFALMGLWYRISDKMSRWKNMTIKGTKPENESLLDTFRDIANYAMIAQLVTQGNWKE